MCWQRVARQFAHPSSDIPRACCSDMCGCRLPRARAIAADLHRGQGAYAKPVGLGLGESKADGVDEGGLPRPVRARDDVEAVQERYLGARAKALEAFNGCARAGVADTHAVRSIDVRRAPWS